MGTRMTGRPRGLLVRARSGALVLGGTVGLLWSIELVNLVLGGALTQYGIHPRSVDGLLGVLFAPFLHASLTHLALNTVSFVVLGALTMTRKPLDFWVVSVTGALTSGLGAWVIGGANTVHVGLSGVIFAYLGFLMARGWFERRVAAVVMSAFVTWAFGGLVWGVLPTVGAHISWEAHLFGLLGGVLVARVLGTAIRGAAISSAQCDAPDQVSRSRPSGAPLRSSPSRPSAWHSVHHRSRVAWTSVQSALPPSGHAVVAVESRALGCRCVSGDPQASSPKIGRTT